jgi:hypothetical protein
MSAVPPEKVPLPTFVIVGAQKSGTRWLRYNLGLHPDIYTAAVEPNFFIDERADGPAGLEWYRSYFDGWAGEPIIGEATPAYMMWHHDPARSAERVRLVLPEARLLAILRNPIDRAQSALIHHIKKGRLPPDADLMAEARKAGDPDDRLSLVAGSWYSASLRPYAERFGEALLVLIHDDVSRAPATVYAAALRHVGASDDFVPADIDAVRFSNQPSESDGPTTPLTDDQRAELWTYFADDVKQLEQLIDRDLSFWAPTA